MKYFYYPGCSLEGTAQEYDASTRAVIRALGAELVAVADWTCCGASAGEAVSHLLSLALPARNLALAEQSAIDADMLVPCSACYLNLKKVEEHTRRDGTLLATINEVLAEEGLSCTNTVKVRHLLDVLARDIGARTVQAKVVRPLTGVTIAPYYGCQCLRPYEVFDDPQQPTSMEPLIEALGATVLPWQMGAQCCGAGLMTTKKETALERVSVLLQAARGADCIATVCPMCQMNLDSYQAKISRMNAENLAVSVLYLPQLMGLAFGLPEKTLKLHLNFAYAQSLKGKMSALRHAAEAQQTAVGSEQ